MGAKERRKGYEGERSFAKAVGGQRMPLSGAVKGFEGDVRGIGLIWQVKVRANGVKRLYDWLKGHDALAIRSDRHEWLAVLPLDTLLNLLPAEERDNTIIVEEKEIG